MLEFCLFQECQELYQKLWHQWQNCLQCYTSLALLYRKRKCLQKYLNTVSKFIVNALKLCYCKLYQEKVWSENKLICYSFSSKMLLPILLFLKIKFLVLLKDDSFQRAESIVAYSWRECESILCSSLDSYA